MSKSAPTPRGHFYLSEEKVRTRLLTVMELIAEQQLHEQPCPLLAAQLNELSVMCSKLQTEIRKLEQCVRDAGYTP